MHAPAQVRRLAGLGDDHRPRIAVDCEGFEDRRVDDTDQRRRALLQHRREIGQRQAAQPIEIGYAALLCREQSAQIQRPGFGVARDAEAQLVRGDRMDDVGGDVLPPKDQPHVRRQRDGKRAARSRPADEDLIGIIAVTEAVGLDRSDQIDVGILEQRGRRLLEQRHAQFHEVLAEPGINARCAPVRSGIGQRVVVAGGEDRLTVTVRSARRIPRPASVEAVVGSD